MDAGALVMYTIYDHPLDYPNHYVVRPWTVTGGGEPVPGTPTLTATLDEARSLIPGGLHRIDATPGEDQAILETWL